MSENQETHNGEVGKTRSKTPEGSASSEKPDPACIPNSNFRPNPQRSVFIQGTIDQQLVDRLTPQILLLHHQSREPITVYIDSPGGSTAHAEILLKLLRATDQEGSKSCRLITVATSLAASAAADILCSGDYACTYPHSFIIHHGTSRMLAGDGLNLEDASSLMQDLRPENDRYAMTLAHRSISRFVFRYITDRSKFAEYRQKKNKTSLNSLECFTGIASEQLSPAAQEVLEKAKNRHARYKSLLGYAQKSKRKRKEPKRQADYEAFLLKKIIDFEMSRNKDEFWTFEADGISQLTDDFFVVAEYLNAVTTPTFNRLCAMWGESFLTKPNREELEKIKGEEERKTKKVELVAAYIRPIWVLFVALCHALQEGENRLTATDAYWLGLIDEVVGISDLSSIRVLVENGTAKMIQSE